MEDRMAEVRKKSLTHNPQFSEFGKLPPQAVNIEEATLGALMLEGGALSRILDVLSNPEAFYKEEHKEIFTAIINLYTKTKPTDLVSVGNELRSTGKLEFVGGQHYLNELTGRVSSSASIEHHARIIMEKFMLRELIRISNVIIQDAFEDTTDVFDLIENVETEIYQVTSSVMSSDYTKANVVALKVFEYLEVVIKNRIEGKMSGIPSSFTDLDRVTYGWQNSDLVILAARPGMGKTALALAFARNAAVDFGIPVAFFSLEMSETQLMTRLMAGEAEVHSQKFRSGDIQDLELEQLHKKTARLVNSNLFIDDTPGLTAFELRSKCRRLKQKEGIKMIILDYIQLMGTRSQDRRGMNREQEISNISRNLKIIAKELDIPVIALSQLSREVEKRTSKMPVLADLRESGSIEQDADQVLFIYRPEYYGLNEDDEGNPTQGMAKIRIAKNRNGPLKTITLRWIEQFAKFANIDDFDDNVQDSLNFEEKPEEELPPF
jgi:replicative DNA helicase